MTSSPRAVPSVDRTVAALDAFATWAVRSTTTRDLSLTSLSALAELERAGPVRLSELAGRASVAQPSMTSLVSRLERDGLAKRSSDPNDGRAVNVVITELGRTVLADRRRRRVRALASILEHADAEDRALIAAAAPALARLTELAPTPAGASPGSTPPQETVS